MTIARHEPKVIPDLTVFSTVIYLFIDILFTSLFSFQFLTATAAVEGVVIEWYMIVAAGTSYCSLGFF